jgi:hypothetical protein
LKPELAFPLYRLRRGLCGGRRDERNTIVRKRRERTAGTRKLVAESWKPEAGSRKLEAGSRKPEAGSWKPEAGSW